MKSEDLDHRGNPRFAFAGDLRELKERVEALERREGMYKEDMEAAEQGEAELLKRFGELAEEFRRMAAGARKFGRECLVYNQSDPAQAMRWRARARTWDDAAQMVEERLNG